MKAIAKFSPFILASNVIFVTIPVVFLLSSPTNLGPMFNKVQGAVLALLCLACLLLYRVKLPPEVLLFWGFLAWGAATGIFLMKNSDYFYDFVVRLISIGVLLFSVVGLTTIKRTLKLNFALVVVWALFLAAFAHFTGAQQLGFSAAAHMSDVNAQINRNLFGMMMLQGLVCLTYFWGIPKLGMAFLRPAIVVMVLPLTAATVTAASRGAMIGLVAYVLLWLWFCYRKKVLRNVGAVLVVAAALVATYFLYDFVVHHTYLGERFQTTIDEGGDVQRFGMYTRGIELFLENPVAGIGFGQFQEVSGFEEYSHSDYIEVLSSTGIVGFVLYFSIFLVLWLRIARLRRLTSDPEITYALGVFKAVICVTLMMQFVYPKMLSPEHWYWMAPIIGYTYGLSLDFAERAAANGEAGRLAVSPPRRLRSA